MSAADARATATTTVRIVPPDLMEELVDAARRIELDVCRRLVHWRVRDCVEEAGGSSGIAADANNGPGGSRKAGGDEKKDDDDDDE